MTTSSSGWRHWALLRLVILVVVLIAVMAATGGMAHALVAKTNPLRHQILIGVNLISAAALIIVYRLVVRGLEQRNANEIDLRPGHFGLGLLGGAILMALVYLPIWALGLAHFTNGTGLDGMAGNLALFFAAAVLEELLFRAVLFRIVEQMGGTTAAILVSALVFGLLHMGNPGVTVMGIVAVVVAAGIAFALLYAMTRNLWLVIGVHMGWNFAEGGLFGAQVSGGAPTHSLFQSTFTGPDILTGGSFGPEGSIFTIAVYLLLSAVIGWCVLRTGNWRKTHFTLSVS